jgi:hypothetical protein
MKLNIEELSRAKNKSLSSQPKIKFGSNKGFSRIEKNGNWIYLDGYDYHCRQQEKSIHYNYLKTLINMGFRIGSYDLDGVKSFYIFQNKEQIHER